MYIHSSLGATDKKAFFISCAPNPIVVNSIMELTTLRIQYVHIRTANGMLVNIICKHLN